MHFYIRWLSNGELPLLNRQTGFMMAEQEGSFEWVEHYSRQSHFMVRLEEITHADLRTFLAKPLPQGQTLVVLIRGSFHMAEFNGASIAIAVVSEILEGAVPFDDLQEDYCSVIQQVLQFSFYSALDWGEVDATPFIQDRYRQFLADTAEGRVRWAAHEAQRLEQRQEAAVRATRLLEEHLTPDQVESLRAHKSFKIRGSDGHTYLICTGSRGNVFRLNYRGDRKWAFCIHLEDSWFDQYPIEDHMLAQKLLLETDARAFLKIANPRRVRAVARQAIPGVR